MPTSLKRYQQNSEFLITEGNTKFLVEAQPKIAIIAPTLDAVPSRHGNAIYDLVGDIAINSKYPILVISRYFSDHPTSKIPKQVIYFKFDRSSNWFETLIGYRGRKVIRGISHYYDLYYLKEVLKFLAGTSVKVIMLEDHTSFFPAISSKWTKRFTILHHQHSNALISLSKFWGRKYLQRLKKVIFVSKTNMLDTKVIHSSSAGKFRYIYNGINLLNYPIPYDDLAPIPDSSSTRLLFVGRIIPGKGVKELIQAVLEICTSDIHLKVVGNLENNLDHGSEAYVQEIKQLVQSSAGNIDLIGQVDQKDLFPYYQWADFVVVPSIAKEGLPKVIFEALVMGKPLIASRRGGIAEFIDHLTNGIFIEDPVSVETIALAIDAGIQYKINLKSYAIKQAKSHRKRLTSERMAIEFDNVFKSYL